LGDRGKLLVFYVLSTYLLFIFLIIPLQITYGNDFSEIAQSSQVDNRYYTDSKQTLVSQKINRSTTNGVELVGNVTYVVDGDTLDINGIRVRLSLVDTPARGQPGFKEAKEFVKSLC